MGLFDGIMEFFEGKEKNTDISDLKNELAVNVMEKIKSEHKISDSKGKMIEDYLVDDKKGIRGLFEEIKDKLIEGWMSITDPKLLAEVKHYKEAIVMADTNEKLNKLKDEFGISQEPEKSEGEGTTTSTRGSDVSQEETTDSSSNHTDTADKIESAPIGEAAEIPMKDRKARLFPDGFPSNEKQMQKYLTTVTVPIITGDGKEGTKELVVHKKLEEEYKAIFKDLKNSGIKVESDSTATYNWRKMRKGNSMSHHSYGTAIDLNASANGGCYGETDTTSEFYNNADTVAIFKRHGFLRGGDWSKAYNDPMHFTYLGS